MSYLEILVLYFSYKIKTFFKGVKNWFGGGCNVYILDEKRYRATICGDKADKNISEIATYFEISPPLKDTSRITISYEGKKISTLNRTIRKIRREFFVPLHFGLVSFLYEKHRDTDIEIEIVKNCGLIYRRIIPHTYKKKLEGWTKELEKTLSCENIVLGGRSLQPTQTEKVD